MFKPNPATTSSPMVHSNAVSSAPPLQPQQAPNLPQRPIAPSSHLQGPILPKPVQIRTPPAQVITSRPAPQSSNTAGQQLLTPNAATSSPMVHSNAVSTAPPLQLQPQQPPNLPIQPTASQSHNLLIAQIRPPSAQVITARPAPQTSNGGSTAGQQLLTPNASKLKCKNFFETLICLAKVQNENVANHVCLLIQGLIDGKIEPEVFTNKLQCELNSSPQPCLIPFLKQSLPSLQKSLTLGEFSIEGIRPPIVMTNRSQLEGFNGTTQDGARLQAPSIVQVPMVPSIVFYKIDGGGGGGSMDQQQMTSNTVKIKCKKFLDTLLRIAIEQNDIVARNVHGLIQGLIDETVAPDVFATKLQKELKSAPQPCLVPFLKRSIPYLRQSLATGELTIKGVRPPILVTFKTGSDNSMQQEGLGTPQGSTRLQTPSVGRSSGIVFSKTGATSGAISSNTVATPTPMESSAVIVKSTPTSSQQSSNLPRKDDVHYQTVGVSSKIPTSGMSKTTSGMSKSTSGMSKSTSGVKDISRKGIEWRKINIKGQGEVSYCLKFCDVCQKVKDIKIHPTTNPTSGEGPSSSNSPPNPSLYRIFSDLIEENYEFCGGLTDKLKDEIVSKTKAASGKAKPLDEFRERYGIRSVSGVEGFQVMDRKRKVKARFKFKKDSCLFWDSTIHKKRDTIITLKQNDSEGKLFRYRVDKHYDKTKFVVLKDEYPEEESIELKYKVDCNLCTTQTACQYRKKSARRIAYFLHATENPLGRMVTKKSLGLTAHQRCLDYAHGEDMVQNHKIEFEHQLDGFDVSALRKCLERSKSYKCCYCKKPKAATQCVVTNCKRTGYYHLTCGMANGSYQRPGKNESFCHRCTEKRGFKTKPGRLSLESSSAKKEESNKKQKGRRKRNSPVKQQQGRNSQEMHYFESPLHRSSYEAPNNEAEGNGSSVQKKNEAFGIGSLFSSQTVLILIEPLDLEKVMEKCDEDFKRVQDARKKLENSETADIKITISEVDDIDDDEATQLPASFIPASLLEDSQLENVKEEVETTDDELFPECSTATPNRLSRKRKNIGSSAENTPVKKKNTSATGGPNDSPITKRGNPGQHDNAVASTSGLNTIDKYFQKVKKSGRTSRSNSTDDNFVSKRRNSNVDQLQSQEKSPSRSPSPSLLKNEDIIEISDDDDVEDSKATVNNLLQPKKELQVANIRSLSPQPSTSTSNLLNQPPKSSLNLQNQPSTSTENDPEIIAMEHLSQVAPEMSSAFSKMMQVMKENEALKAENLALKAENEKLKREHENCLSETAVKDYEQDIAGLKQDLTAAVEEKNLNEFNYKNKIEDQKKLISNLRRLCKDFSQNLANFENENRDLLARNESPDFGNNSNNEVNRVIDSNNSNGVNSNMGIINTNETNREVSNTSNSEAREVSSDIANTNSEANIENATNVDNDDSSRDTFIDPNAATQSADLDVKEEPLSQSPQVDKVTSGMTRNASTEERREENREMKLVLVCGNEVYQPPN